MLNKTPPTMQGAAKRQLGMSLIIVLIMLIVIGLVSASAIRSATSGEKVVTNVRVQNLAQQYAEAALRFCEEEMKKTSAARVPSLDKAVLDTIVTLGAGWEQVATWTGAGGASASRTVLPLAQVKSVDSSFGPARPPECVVEPMIALDDSFVSITARGFSPDYAWDTSTGETTKGSVVWLQSIVYIE